MTVPMPAELAARLTMARAVAVDYAREARLGGSNGRPDWFAWAARLHTALSGLTSALDAFIGGTGIAGAATFAAADVAVLRRALADAIDYRNDGPGGFCPDCEALPASDLCADHAEDAGLAERYETLARSLGADR
jgi:hypothetical protein